jgi:C4-dicarboxylate transporter DctM subunit
MESVVAFGVLTLLLLIGVPIALALAVAGATTLWTTLGPQALIAVPQKMFGAIDSFTLLSIPFFVLAADLLVASGATRRLVAAMDALVGHWRGGLASVAVLACAFFSAISGSSAATAVAIGSVLVPDMVRKGYPKEHTAGLVAVAGGLGILIPPSIPMIVYGAVAEQSVGRLFVAGILPGLLLTASLLVVSRFVFPRSERPRGAIDTATKARLVREAGWIIVLPAVIAILIYGGIATPTEAAGVAVIYSLGCALVVYRDIRPSDLPRLFADAGGKSAFVLFIIAGATVFGYALTLLQVPQEVTARVLAAQLSPIGFLIIVNLILLVMGMFLDIISILLITSPIFLPVVDSLGIHRIHFGVVFTMNMELALITPPLGMHLFILSGITGLPVAAVFRGVLPFAGAAIFCLIAVTWLPGLSLALV